MLLGAELSRLFVMAFQNAAQLIACFFRKPCGARHVVCPSDGCEEVLSNLTSVVDVEFGPDGTFYVVELDRNGWLAAVTGNPAGGRIQSCDLETGECSVVYESNMSIAAITFDKWDQMWVAENEVLADEGVAVLHQVELIEVCPARRRIGTVEEWAASYVAWRLWAA